MIDTYNYESFEVWKGVQRIFLRFGDDLKVGEQAPDFTLLSLNGAEVTLSEFLGKKCVVLEWGSVT
ncbi:MAG: redoxin domain-containing protein [Candidatus Tectomicrobia bacterium]|nr:redoxin domain-containing protein [Candidatus Tectomicrobia bacterium]